jgi:hypothetical protein
MISDLNLIQDAYEFKNIPDGFYILTVHYGQQTWPVKLIRRDLTFDIHTK